MASRPEYLTVEEIENFFDGCETDESDFSIESVFEPVEEILESDYDSSDKDTLNINNEDTDYISKDKIIRSKTPFLQHGQTGSENIINLKPGITRYAFARISTIKDSFLFYFPNPILKIIMESTNAYGRTKNGNNHIELTVELFHAYLSILLLSGVYKSRNEVINDLFDSKFGRPIFAAIMSKTTFVYVHRTVRFYDVFSRRQNQSTDKFASIRDLWQIWSDLLPIAYNPHECTTIDEQLHGRRRFRQYMPSKLERYGIKFWMLVCASTCYVWKIQSYLGKTGDIPEKNQGKRVVLDLVQGLKGHNITMDNFFTCQELSEELLQRKLTMVGTLRKNKKNIPPKLME